MQISKTGECKIVSSGYEDRYVSTDLEVTIKVEGISFCVSYDDAPKAIAKLRGLDLDDAAVLREIAMEFHVIPANYYAVYETQRDDGGYTLSTCVVKLERVRGGIAIATGFRNLSEFGIDRAKKEAEGLTEAEKNFIRYGLEQVNKKHRERNQPVVEFAI
tara:strand:- start:15137 stop:15616 length:480 start_codon:yes stop_codon:yes gene_type:complete